MSHQKKVYGEERRAMLLEILRSSSEPITGSELAKQANVSRQVIVGDISLLKAKQEPIIATSQGYMYLNDSNNINQVERTIVSYHTADQTEAELNLLVDHGVIIKDVSVEHPVYGDLTASLHISNRKEVKQFIKQIQSNQATYLLELTGGIHMHTIVATNEQMLDEAVEALDQQGYMVRS